MSKLKFALIASHPNLSTGYAKIGTHIANELTKYFDVIYLGFQNTSNENINRDVNNNVKIYDLYNLDKDSIMGFGDKAILPILQLEKPEFVIIYNDHGVCSSVLKLIEEYKCKKFCYIDFVFEYQYIPNIDFIKKNSKLIAFSESWKKHLIDFYGCKDVIKMYHGVKSYPEIISKEELGFKKDDFVILSMNRNDSRKNIDLVIYTFLNFYKKVNNPNVYLFINCLLETGLLIVEYIKICCRRLELDENIILNEKIKIPVDCGHATDEYIHALYRHCNVGISITSGEGFGLTVIEQLLYNKPVICSRLKIFEELISNDYPYFIDPVTEGYSYDNLGGIKYYFKMEDFLVKLEEIYHKNPSVDYSTIISEKFNWSNIIKEFVDEIS
jgi:glycosyltransferase involved in cell wall biosynthesis